MSNTHHFTADESHIGMRFDAFLSQNMPDISRSMIQKSIKKGKAFINDEMITKTGFSIKSGDERIRIEIEPLADLSDQPQNLPLKILYKDSEIVILHKPAGLVVHPGAGVSSNTLLNALLYHFPETQSLPRGGIVHRLDKDTSGVMVTARTQSAYHTLVDALKERTVTREYTALVYGHLKQSGTVDAPIRRHRIHRQNMTVHAEGKPAVTHYTPMEIIGPFTLLKLHLESGRTHQIRVHMKHIKHPIYGDPVYRTNRPLPISFPRQVLHASCLTLQHPSDHHPISTPCPLPDDINELLEKLRKWYAD